MATAAQIAANRENAQLSTGPKTEQGKFAAAQNARSHGLTGRFCILPGEDPAEFESLLTALTDEHAPSSITEFFLVTEMAQAQWKLRRICVMEVEIFSSDLTPTAAMERQWKNAVAGKSTETHRTTAAQFSADCAHDQILLKLLRYEEAARRSWYKALNQLRQMRAQNESLENLRQNRLAKQADLEADRLIAQALTPPVIVPPAAKQPCCETKPMPVHLERELEAHKRRDPLFDPRHDRSQTSKELQRFMDKWAA